MLKVIFMYGYGNSGNLVGIIIGVIIGLIIVFIICRELICWYYKINRIVALMEEQNNLLKQQMGLTSNSTIDDWVCIKCGNTNRKTALFCNSCGEKNNPSKLN